MRSKKQYLETGGGSRKTGQIWHGITGFAGGGSVLAEFGKGLVATRLKVVAVGTRVQRDARTGRVEVEIDVSRTRPNDWAGHFNLIVHKRVARPEKETRVQGVAGHWSAL